jgi:hypothetical protein
MITQFFANEQEQAEMEAAVGCARVNEFITRMATIAAFDAALSQVEESGRLYWQSEAELSDRVDAQAATYSGINQF